MSVQSADSIRDEFVGFLKQHGCGDASLGPLAGGANNRVYRVPRTAGDWVLKSYFRTAGDTRDRFGAERSFYQWIWTHGIRRTPEPIAWEQQKRLGLFTFIAGRKLQPEEVNVARVNEAVDFLLEINTARSETESQKLPIASEGCFDVQDHLACVDRRITRVQQISVADDLDRQAAGFVREELAPAWSRFRARITSDSELSQAPIALAERCLSPSDFGFHNALLHADGRLRFFDFEYAGWDDPAKTICDFFCQPELSVSPDLWTEFAGRIAEGLKAGPGLPARARRLWPAYQIKWCCIILNEFVGSEQSRRAFSAGTEVSTERRSRQLAKARSALATAVGS